ncbi:MAG TPA: isochorismatase family cysteine hydrolase [Burkholderiales bacterium]|nr:isochorismatase family cysteine hydrolase [Burkholderiales bacterium]
MPARNPDLHGNAPDACDAALLLIDVINDLEFPGGEALLASALRAARKIRALKVRARAAGMPVIYANDNFGRWRSDFRQVVEHCLTAGVRGQPLAELLAPDREDYFVVKPKHSAFYATPLELLLTYLKTRRLIVTGLAGDVCVLMTAADAYVRDLEVFIPSDCIASQTPAENRKAIQYMARVFHADVRPSARLDVKKLAGKVKRARKAR